MYLFIRNESKEHQSNRHSRSTKSEKRYPSNDDRGNGPHSIQRASDNHRQDGQFQQERTELPHHIETNKTANRQLNTPGLIVLAKSTTPTPIVGRTNEKKLTSDKEKVLFNPKEPVSSVIDEYFYVPPAWYDTADCKPHTQKLIIQLKEVDRQMQSLIRNSKFLNVSFH